MEYGNMEITVHIKHFSFTQKWNPPVPSHIVIQHVQIIDITSEILLLIFSSCIM